MKTKHSFIFISIISIFIALGTPKTSKAQLIGIIEYESTLNSAKTRYIQDDYNGAIRILRKMDETYPNNFEIHYLLGECFFEDQEMEKAIEYFEKVYASNPKYNKELFSYLGRSYQSLGDFDKALSYYNTYLLLSKDDKNYEKDIVHNYIKQVNLAKDLLLNPVDVSIKNLGLTVNSNYTDAAPLITPDGQTLIFTSRRPETTGGGKDLNTGQYFDDIYMSEWDANTKQWKEAEQIPELNSDGFDSPLSISSDGNQIYIYKNQDKVTQSGDIWFSKRKESGKWSSPKSLSPTINSSYFETSASLSPDGNTLFFISERKNGLGKGDIWMSRRISATEWEKPTNIGAPINSPEDEISVFMHPDGKTLYFSSNGYNSIGGYDIFKTVFENGKWSNPVNLGYPINTIKDEVHFSLTADNKTAYISAKKESGYGDYDIYEVDLSRYSLNSQNKAPKLAILKGNISDNQGNKIATKMTIINTATNKDYHIESNDNGDYSITIPAESEYKVTIELDGYKKNESVFFMNFDPQTIYTRTQPIVLEKK